MEADQAQVAERLIGRRDPFKGIIVDTMMEFHLGQQNNPQLIMAGQLEDNPFCPLPKTLKMERRETLKKFLFDFRTGDYW